MARSLTLTLGSGLGINLGPNFTLSADTGTVIPNTATRSELIAGKIVLVDDNAQVVIITSVGDCTNSIQQVIPCVTTSTTSTTSTSTSSTTTTTSGTTTSTTTEGTTTTTTEGTTTTTTGTTSTTSTTAATTTTTTAATTTTTTAPTTTTTTTTAAPIDVCDCYTYTLSNSDKFNSFSFSYSQCGTGLEINGAIGKNSTINICAISGSMGGSRPPLSWSQGAACTDARFCPTTTTTSTSTSTTTAAPTTIAPCPNCVAASARKAQVGSASGVVTFMDCNGAIQQISVQSQVPRNFTCLDTYPVTWTGGLRVDVGFGTSYQATKGDWVLGNGCTNVDRCKTQSVYLRNTGTYGFNFFSYVEPTNCTSTLGSLGPGAELFLDIISGSYAGTVALAPLSTNPTGSQCCITRCAINNFSVNCVTGSIS